jgi:hypothetical protein
MDTKRSIRKNKIGGQGGQQGGQLIVQMIDMHMIT